MELFDDFSSLACPGLEELVCSNGKILARGLSTNRPSSSSNHQPKSRPHFITTNRSPAIVTDHDLINNATGAAKPTSGSRSPAAVEQLKSNYVKPPPPPLEGGGNILSVLRPLMEVEGRRRGDQLSATPDDHDEQSRAQAPGYASGSSANTIKEKPYAGKLVDREIPTTTSTCSSREASNDVQVMRWRYENTKGVANRSKIARESGTGRGKRKTKEDDHKLTEKRTDYKINKKMRELQKLVPNARKVDKASILDEAIRYLTALQLQVQIMSMGNGIAMPPITLPTEMQLMQASYVAPFWRTNVGFGYNTLLPFSASRPSTIPGDKGLVLQTSVSGAPFIPPFNGGHPSENLW